MWLTVLDVGGTHVRWARWSPDQGLGEVRRVPSPSLSRCADASVAELRASLVSTMADPVPHGAVASVSFGAALDHRTGTVYASAPLWGAHDEPFDLLAALEECRPDVRWHVVNDVTAALLHLTSTPAARGLRKVLLATISTGIACRTIDQRVGRIPVDGCGLQGEIGHLPAHVAIDDVPVELGCDCGRPDHVASFSSGPGIRRLSEVLRERRAGRWAASSLGSMLARGEAFEASLTQAVARGDQTATELLEVATKPMADVVRTALCLDPEIDLVAFTGGVAVGLGEHYRASMLTHLTREGLYLTSEREPDWVRERVVVSRTSGLIGAGLAALAAEPA
ncbi:ROK family protein [Cellulomonas sp.]|uniref:ROK family protein n=1 Tax=Cellulomonas sp. TaxID=40001 RepID=UPI002811A678|nr:ROK family protein [Cellulomonas sp.]